MKEPQGKAQQITKEPQRVTKEPQRVPKEPQSEAAQVQ